MAIRRSIGVLLAAAVLAACNDAGTSAAASTPEPLPKPAVAALAAGDWQAGVARGPLFAPFGLSMGGFAARLGPITGRNDRLGGSLGRYQRLLVKALAIGNGHGLVLLVKLPMVFPTDLLRRRVLAVLAARTGLDFGDALVLNATHTHSGPARYWALPEGVGMLGMDEFDPAVLAALADSIATVAAAAWRDMHPARIGATELLRYDPEQRINRDRRAHNDDLYGNLDDPNVYDDGGIFKSKDHRMWLLRVEDRDGQPLAGVVRMGIHGTVLMHQLYSEDAPGNIERAAERLWGVPTVLFLQGAAGDVSPAGDDQGRGGPQQIEAVALRAARAGHAAWQAIDTEARGVFAIAHRRRTIDRRALGYADDEFGQGRGAAFQPYHHGAMLCGEVLDADGVDEGRPATRLRDGELGCLSAESIQGMLVPAPEDRELPIGELSTAVLSAVRLGDWRLLTFPGEPVSQLGTAMHAAAAADGVERLAVLGYSQAHLFYLTPAADWFQGGYEAVMNLWGWRLGEFLVAENRALLARLDRYGHEPVWDGDPLVPLAREFERRRVTVRPQRTAPSWDGLSATAVARQQTIVGRWTGGDSWLDPAAVALVDADGTVVADDGGWGWALLGPTSVQAEPAYRVHLEPGLDVPLGTYRFRVRGAVQGPEGPEPYELHSPPFDVVAAARLAVTATAAAGGGWHLYPSYDPNPERVAPISGGPEGPPGDALVRRQSGGFRLVTDSVGPEQRAPLWTGTVEVAATVWPSGAGASARLTFEPACRCFPWTTGLPPGSVTATVPAGGLVFRGDVNGVATVVP